MSRDHIYGWDYPPGAQNDPNAPWNEPEDYRPEELEHAIVDAVFDGSDEEFWEDHFLERAPHLLRQFVRELHGAGPETEGMAYDIARMTACANLRDELATAARDYASVRIARADGDLNRLCDEYGVDYDCDDYTEERE